MAMEFKTADSTTSLNSSLSVLAIDETNVLPYKIPSNHFAELDSSTNKLLDTQIPDSILGGVIYKGVWDASINTPTILTGSATSSNKGYYYKTSVAGSTTVDGTSTWAIGDWIISNGTTWDRIKTTESSYSIFTGATSSTAGATGLVPAPNSGAQNYALLASGSFGAVPVLGGGTGLTSIVTGSLLVANSANTLSAITSTSGIKMPVNSAGTTSFVTVTGTGSPVLATSPVLTTPIANYIYSTSGTSMNVISNGTYLLLGAGGNVKMTMDSSGYVYIGANAASSYPLYIGTYTSVTFSSYGYLSSSGAGTNAGSTTANVSIRAVERIIASEFDAVSDGRLKENIIEIDSIKALEMVENIRAVSYNWKSSVSEETGTKLGWIAQEVGEGGIGEAITKMAHTLKDGTELEDYHVLDKAQLTAVLWAAVKQLSTKVTALEAKLV